MRRFVVPLLLWSLGCCAALGAPWKPKQLARQYQEWLSGPTSYLITKAERDLFLNLATDEQRDKFIERFWEVRNPSPGGAGNAFKDEFYRRLAFVNANYGKYEGSDGWRTDKGKTYILFGKPKTSMSFVHNQEMYPVELWFFANPGLAELPPFFYVMFFERDGVSGYTLYNPLTDGPDKLVREVPTKKQAYNYLRGINAELARASLTLIPGEPIDDETYGGSMESIGIINAIQSYREMPSYQTLISARAARLERVTTRIEYDVPRSSLTALVVRENGEHWLHWRFEIQDPMQSKAKDGRAAYEIAAQLYSRDKLVFERNDAPSFPVAAADEEALKKRAFIYQDRMPVAPGAYRLVVSAKNRATGRVYEATKDFAAAAPADRPVVSEIVLVGGREQDTRVLPFQFSGVKFAPAVGGWVRSVTRLNVLYQVSAPEPRPAELEVEYVIGNLATKFRKTLAEKLDMTRADAAGSLLVAKALPIEDVSPGSYLLAVRVKDPRTGAVGGGSAGFTVLGPEEAPAPIVISRGATDTPQWNAVNQYERALCWLSQDRPLEAVAHLEASWKLNQNPATRALLQQLYERTGQTKAVN